MVILVILFSVILQALAAEPVIYIVKKGDTAYSIAKANNVSIESILAINSIRDPKTIKAGQKLIIPSVYKVVKDDTLYGIARKFGVSVADLIKINKLESDFVLIPGKVLCVPGLSLTVGGTGASPIPTPTVPKVQGIEERPSTLTKAVLGPWPAEGPVSYLDGKLFGVMIDVQAGSRIVAVRSGKVVSAGPFRGYGNVCFIQASDGLVYVYGGAGSLNLNVGDLIQPGSEIGIVGEDLSSKKLIVYFFVFKAGKALDPVKVLRER